MLHGHGMSHPLTLSFYDLSVWCYACEAYIDNQVSWILLELMHTEEPCLWKYLTHFDEFNIVWFALKWGPYRFNITAVLHEAEIEPYQTFQQEDRWCRI
jgi:hypothetical protein